MGALLSQAVANQLRQYPGSMNPNVPPSILIQQALNPPGPSRPTSMAPVMENQQLLATSMDPMITQAQRDAMNQALARNATAAAISFGGADITKEERAKWEKENLEYREKQTKEQKQIPVGTRVVMAMDRWDPKTKTTGIRGRTGTIIDPKEGMTVHTPVDALSDWKPRSPRPGDDWVLMEYDRMPEGQQDRPPYFPQWVRRDWLDILPPEYKYRLAPASWIDRVNVSPPDPEHGRPQFWFDDPETAEKANVLRNVGPPFKLRQRSMPKNIVRVQEPVPTPPPGQGVGVKYRSTLMNWKPEDIEVEIRDNVWIPLTEWMKRRK